MQKEKSEKLIIEIINFSRRILLQGYGVNSVEFCFFEVIEIVRSNKDLQKFLLKKIKHSFDSKDFDAIPEGSVPAELIELIAHELRWEELKHLSVERIVSVFHGDRSKAINDVSIKVIDAFSDNWADREFYKKYRNF